MDIVGTCINCISPANASLTIAVALIGLLAAVYRDFITTRT
jgi:hypothetical protein